MVVYVDGKPIFVQNPNLIDPTMNERDLPLSRASSQHQQQPARVRIPYAEIESNRSSREAKSVATTSYHLGDTRLDTTKPVVGTSTTSRQAAKGQQSSRDMEYMQLVSMFKQKNEKLFNPMN